MSFKNKIAFVFLVACLFRFDASAQSETIKLSSFYDSLSYSFGVENALGIYRIDPKYSALNKVKLVEGFQSHLSGEAFEKSCGTTLHNFIGSNDSELNGEYLNEGSYCIGSIVASEFYTQMDDIQYLVDLNLSYVLFGFKDAVFDKAERLIPIAEQSSMILRFKEMVEADFIAEIERADRIFWSKALKNEKLQQVGETGIYIETIEQGSGGKPVEGNDIDVHYILTNNVGDTLENSYANGRSSKLNLNRVIDGWKEGFLALEKGGKYRLYVPFEKAYKGSPPSRPQGALCFFIEFIDFGPKGSLAQPPPVIKQQKN